ncbi:Membrane-fusion protein [Fulvimarina pelagi HTCC2506]|uniref:Membrane-fusion protein n=1 Tax=Fulvimarina pelagi HTCC2506 TaxID=314231 RepID=Q0FXX3_9HYPH|nr:efflux RND transporter periplasmic adaptor subunit [Fulvimarina pelagi]EAU39760.1 Membrane-fusion protein [Fulvimarina pelagi HTCC2506]
MRGRYVALSILALSAGFGGGIAVERLYFAVPSEGGESGPKVLYWVAPMDANFRRDSPGKSPMGMDLVPVYEGEEPSGDPQEVELSPQEVNAIGVRTAVARVEAVAPFIETVGFVTYDEDATSHVHTRISGWVEDLRIRSLGDPVREGEPLFEIYGPRQERAGTDRIGAPTEYLRVTAPQSGVVTALNATDGMYLEPGVRAMSITDLSSVWVIADVFEKDIGRLTEGMRAEARFEPLPGKVFEGTVDYIYPELDQKTRTLSVRLRFDNPDQSLRPNMYGRIRLTGALVSEAVTVPSEAVIRTGRAERVILRTGEGAFRPRLVTTGLRDGFGAGGRTEIKQGLRAGEEVVASAQFLIDSESALSAGTTRMAPTADAPATGKGMLVSEHPQRNTVTIEHAAIPSLDWPALTTTFALKDGVRLDRVEPGEAVRFSLARGSDGLLSLVQIGRDDGVDATGLATVHAVTPDGKLSVSHDPIPALSWPAMTMDMPAQGVDLDAVPLETRVEIDLSEGEGGVYSIIAVRPVADEARPPATQDTPAAGVNADLMTVSGTINSVDTAKGLANITHGPMTEIGMPGMTMDFGLGAKLDPSALPVGAETTLYFAMDPETFEMTLEGFETAENVEPPMEVSGKVNAVDPKTRKANITHGPMADIGMPGMTMDFVMAESLAPDDLPLGEETTLLISMDPATFEMTLEGVAR